MLDSGLGSAGPGTLWICPADIFYQPTIIQGTLRFVPSEVEERAVALTLGMTGGARAG